jgi:hypothetical protein
MVSLIFMGAMGSQWRRYRMDDYSILLQDIEVRYRVEVSNTEIVPYY